ncbi:hypothetical protein BX616_001503, partial [Lobosporangium transversale]
MVARRFPSTLRNQPNVVPNGAEQGPQVIPNPPPPPTQPGPQPEANPTVIVAENDNNAEDGNV